VNNIQHYLKTRHQFPKNATQEDYDVWIEEIDKLDIPDPRYTPIKKSEIKKGIAEGIKFDSVWEYIVYIYYKKIKCIPCERNRTEFLLYIDPKGKTRKFFPDFLVSGKLLEVKGQFRPNDMCKMEQCPQVEFIDAEAIKPIKKEVEKFYPNFEDQYFKTN
jgi:hypothetical protein